MRWDEREQFPVEQHPRFDPETFPFRWGEHLTPLFFTLSRRDSQDELSAYFFWSEDPREHVKLEEQFVFCVEGLNPQVPGEECDLPDEDLLIEFGDGQQMLDLLSENYPHPFGIMARALDGREDFVSFQRVLFVTRLSELSDDKCWRAAMRAFIEHTLLVTVHPVYEEDEDTFTADEMRRVTECVASLVDHHAYQRHNRKPATREIIRTSASGDVSPPAELRGDATAAAHWYRETRPWASCGRIAKWLEEHEFLTPRGNATWHAKQVSRMFPQN